MRSIAFLYIPFAAASASKSAPGPAESWGTRTLGVEGLSTAALSFAIGVLEGKLGRQLGLLPIHLRSHDVKHRHGIHKHANAVVRDLFVALLLFQRIVHGVAEAVAAAPPHSQANAQRVGLVGQQLFYPLRSALGESDGRREVSEAASSRGFFRNGRRRLAEPSRSAHRNQAPHLDDVSPTCGAHFARQTAGSA
eukprot:scaffold564_cov248-Pinguiococcus_pyrenoidosus.AAC.4